MDIIKTLFNGCGRPYSFPQQKMNPFRRKGASALEVLNYTYPVLHTGKMWYIDFRCYDPISRTMKRKKYHISDKLSAREKRAYATNLIAGLVENLQRG